MRSFLFPRLQQISSKAQNHLHTTTSSFLFYSKKCIFSSTAASKNRVHSSLPVAQKRANISRVHLWTGLPVVFNDPKLDSLDLNLTEKASESEGGNMAAHLVKLLHRGGFTHFQNQKGRLQMIDSHFKKNNNTNTDIITAYRGRDDDTPNDHVVNLLAIIEMKKYGSLKPDIISEFPETSKNLDRIIQYCQMYLEHHPQRIFTYGLLADGKSSVLVRVHRLRHTDLGEDPDTAPAIDMIWAGEDKKNLSLKWLLSQSDAALGADHFAITINGTEHKLQKYIGRGQHAYGFEVKLENDADPIVVVKYYPRASAANREREIYNRLNRIRNRSGVTSLATHQPILSTTNTSLRHQPTSANFLACSPRGFRFHFYNSTPSHPDHPKSFATFKHFKQLRDMLKRMHSKKITHGDIGHGNILWVNDSEAVINDWSHSQDWSLKTDWAVEKQNFDEACGHDKQMLDRVLGDMKGASYTAYCD